MNAPKLRHAQVQGTDFLASHPKAYLCLRMRMGKSAVALQQCVKGKRTLIISPVIVKTHWARECALWRPDLGNIDILHSKTCKQNPKADVTIVAYSVLFDLLAAGALHRPDYLIVDEVHYAKNYKAKRTKAVTHLIESTPRVACLTGTPIPNRPVELFPVLKALGCPDAKNFMNFTERVCDAYQGEWGYVTDGHSNLDELKTVLSDWMFHSQGGHVPTVPTVIEMDVPLSAQERKAMTEIDWSNPSIPFEALSEIRRLSGMRKIKQAAEHVRDCLENMDKVVVACWHQDVIDALFQELEEFNPIKVDGRTRDKFGDAERFQNAPENRVFIGQMITAGIGISLAAADHMVFVENDWVPGNMDQMLARIETAEDQETGRTISADILVSAGGIDSKVIHSVISKMDVINNSLNEDIA